MIQILPAGSEEASIVASLSRKTFYETFAPVNEAEHIDQFMREQFSQALLEAELDNGNNYFFLLYDDAEPVGYVKLCEGREPEQIQGRPAMEIARLYVLGSRIGKGMGAALMEHALDFARSRQKEIVWLGVWEKNETAISFYRKWGFHPFGTHIFMMGTDPQTDWLMMKVLDAEVSQID